MRNLIYVPVVHTALDMGSLGGQVERLYRARFGAEKWQAHGRIIQEMWGGITERLSALQLDFAHVRLYQDGLPVCGKEEQIVRDLAARGSLNHRLVAQLMERGARLMGTESPELLLREYHLVKSQLSAGQACPPSPPDRLAADPTLRARDEFVAARIAATLAEGETGVLFMGLAHAVQRYLPPDIQLQLLIHRLPFGTGVAQS